MFCFKCGASMPDTAAACPQCGAAARTVQPPSAPAAASAPAPAQGTPWLNIPRAQPYTGPQQTDGKAVGSLILGIFALLLPLAGLVLAIPGVILGHLSRKSIRESLGRLKGDGMALAGLIMGYLSVAAIPMILIIAAIAIPSLLRSKMLANESAAQSGIRTIITSQAMYVTNYAAAGYARDLATLGPGSSGSCAGEGTQEHACFLDGKLGCTSDWCVKNGYRFNVAATCEAGAACADYVITATPITPGTTGTKSFCSTADAVIRVRTAGPVLTAPTVAECQSWPAVM